MIALARQSTFAAVASDPLVRTGPGGDFVTLVVDSPDGLVAIRDRTHPPVISHHLGRSFADEFDWQGTFDPAPWLSAGDAIDFTMSAAGGSLRERNRQLARWAHDMLCARLGQPPLVESDSDELLGSMACVRVPDALRHRFASAAQMQAWLYSDHRIEIPVIDFGGWHVRLSAAPHNTNDDYERLASALCA